MFAAQFSSMDAIVSNPPYIPAGELPVLQEEVRREPASALDGGADGLQFYRALAAYWIPRLRPGGVAAVEIGEGQAHAVADLFAQAGLEQIRFANDLGGICRVVAGVRTG